MSTTAVWAQNLLTDSSSTILIEDFRTSLQKSEFDSQQIAAYQHQSLSQFLSRTTGIFVKEYGSGIATLSNRGGSSAHTAVLWEGVNIQNPMLAQNDLSLLPMVFIDRLSFQAAGSSALDGNNAMNGSLQISSSPVFEQGLRLQVALEAGSFGRQSYQGKIQFGSKRYAGKLALFYQEAQNDFPYLSNQYGDSLIRQVHAFQQAYGILMSQAFKWKRHRVKVQSWLQHSFRQLPPNMLQTTGDAEHQLDQSIRHLLSWSYYQQQQWMELKLAHIGEQLHYYSNIVNSDSRMQQFLLSWKHRFYWQIASETSFKLQYAAEYQQQSALSNNFSDRVLQPQAALQLAASFEHQQLESQLQIRQVWVDQQWVQPLAAINLQYLALNRPRLRVQLLAAYGLQYRYPSLNDRFWPQAGNPDLLPEYAQSTDLKAQINYQLSRFCSIKASSNGYYNRVKNWILWEPDGLLWRPSNLARVHSLGIENQLVLHYQHNNWQLELMGRYDWNLNHRRNATDPMLNGKRLLYTPAYRALSQLQLYYKNSSIEYLHQFTGKSYLDNYNLSYLDAYQLATLQFSHQFRIQKVHFSIHLQMDNLWNQSYQVIANRAMPGRNFRLGLRVNY